MKVGDRVDDFELLDQDGVPRRLSELAAEQVVVLFFYPMALSAGCTAEACHFRDLSAELAAVGARPVGISADAVERQQKFAERNGLQYPLLSDPERAVAVQFGVRGRLGIPVKRHTFVIDTDLTVLEIVRSPLNMTVHADRALEVLKAR